MPLDFLFRRPETRRAGLRALREPFLEPPRRIELQLPPPQATPAQPEPVVPDAPVPDSHIKVRAMSPREMADWAHELYMTGWIGWDEYRASIPPELHPDYDTTVGALTGEPAEPDRPRDMIREWEERLAFAERHCDSGDDRQLRLAERIVSLLRWQDAPRRMDA